MSDPTTLDSMSVSACLFCGAKLPPPDMKCCTDEEGRPLRWCSETCSATWCAQDPKRSEGWVSLADLGPAATKRIFRDSGFDLDIDDTEPS